MAMAPMPEQGGEPQAPGGASQLVADTHSNLLKLQELLGDKFPDSGQELTGLIQGFQSFVEGLGRAPGQEAPSSAPATTTPEAGAANVRPAM